jgi:hypothetical protein
VQKRPQPKAAAVKQKTDSALQISKTAASRSRSAVLLRAVEAQQSAHELLDQLGVAKLPQQLLSNLSAVEIQLIKRVTKLLDQLRITAVANQKIQRTITQQRWEDYQAELSASTAQDVLLQGGIPDQLRYYGEHVAKADKINALADAAAGRNSYKSSAAAKKLRNKAESIYEAAAFYLQDQLEIIDGETEMRIRAWLDRDFDNSTSGTISPDCVGIARIRGTASEHCLDRSKKSTAEKKQRLHELQLRAVTVQLQTLIYKNDEPTASIIFDRDKILKRLDIRKLHPERD